MHTVELVTYYLTVTYLLVTSTGMSMSVAPRCWVCSCLQRNHLCQRGC
jgi:hypothetical protein